MSYTFCKQCGYEKILKKIQEKLDKIKTVDFSAEASTNALKEGVFQPWRSLMSNVHRVLIFLEPSVMDDWSYCLRFLAFEELCLGNIHFEYECKYAQSLAHGITSCKKSDVYCPLPVEVFYLLRKKQKENPYVFVCQWSRPRGNNEPRNCVKMYLGLFFNQDKLLQEADTRYGKSMFRPSITTAFLSLGQQPARTKTGV